MRNHTAEFIFAYICIYLLTCSLVFMVFSANFLHFLSCSLMFQATRKPEGGEADEGRMASFSSSIHVQPMFNPCSKAMLQSPKRRAFRNEKHCFKEPETGQAGQADAVLQLFKAIMKDDAEQDRHRG